MVDVIDPAPGGTIPIYTIPTGTTPTWTMRRRTMQRNVITLLVVCVLVVFGAHALVHASWPMAMGMAAAGSLITVASWVVEARQKRRDAEDARLDALEDAGRREP